MSLKIISNLLYLFPNANLSSLRIITLKRLKVITKIPKPRVPHWNLITNYGKQYSSNSKGCRLIFEKIHLILRNQLIWHLLNIPEYNNVLPAFYIQTLVCTPDTIFKTTFSQVLNLHCTPQLLKMHDKKTNLYKAGT